MYITNIVKDYYFQYNNRPVKKNTKTPNRKTSERYIYKRGNVCDW